MLQMMRDVGGVEMPEFFGKLVGDGDKVGSDRLPKPDADTGNGASAAGDDAPALPTEADETAN